MMSLNFKAVHYPQRFEMINKKAFSKLYLWFVIAVGSTVCSYSFLGFLKQPPGAEFFILALFAIVLGPFLIVRIPHLTSQITVSDTFIFLTLLLYGADAAILLAALEALTASLRFSRKEITILFNCAAMAIATFLTSLVLTICFGSVLELSRVGFSASSLAALCVMALVQYFSNTGLVALAAALRLERPIGQTWSKHYLWTSITYIGGASAAAIVAHLINARGFYSVIVTIPIVAVIFLTYRTYRQNLDVAAAHAEQAERHAEQLSLYIAERQKAESERDQLFVREQNARAEAEKANRMKDEFLAMVTHELRTPLTPILGWIRMLRRDELDVELVGGALESIERAAKYQESIINDLLDVSRIVRGKLHLESREIYLSQVIEASLEVVRPAADAKNITINCTNNSPAMLVSGDSRRLKQVMWNVLSNAVKFTPLGGRIDLKIQPKGSYAHIRVTDNGAGIRPDFLPYVFDRFRQDDTRSNEGLGGLGLGLALVRYLTEMHGGNVTAQSLGVGHGATFVIRLPLVNSSACAQSFKSLHAPAGNSNSFSNEIAETVSQTPLGPAQLRRFGGLSTS
jgi:signal transduction histidine kinase